MRRIIVDYSKLTNEILTLLVDRFPDGYDDSNIVRFRNAQNELIEAVEVKTDDTIYLVKVSTKLASRLEKFDEEEDIDDIVEPIDVIKSDLDDDDLVDDEEEENDLTKDSDDSNDSNDDDEDDDDDDDDKEAMVDDEDDEDDDL